MRTALRMNERGITGSVGSLDVNVRFDDVLACRRSRTCRRGEARGHPAATKSRLFLRVSSAICYLLYFTLFIHLRIGPVTLSSAVSGDITSEMWL